MKQVLIYCIKIACWGLNHRFLKWFPFNQPIKNVWNQSQKPNKLESIAMIYKEYHRQNAIGISEFFRIVFTFDTKERFKYEVRHRVSRSKKFSVKKFEFILQNNEYAEIHRLWIGSAKNSDEFHYRLFRSKRLVLEFIRNFTCLRYP